MTKIKERGEVAVQLNHLLDFGEMTLPEWDGLYQTVEQIIDHPEDFLDACRGKVLATTFFEPSTRTIFSFQAAALRLGATYISFSDPNNSSVSKGETLRDTIRIVANYTDTIAIRHSLEGAAKAASFYSPVPIVNAGDGGHLHPTQTLADLVTIRRRIGRTEGLSIGLCGDLKYGRTVHSLLGAMTRFPGNKFYLVSTPELRVPRYVIDILEAGGHEYHEVSTLDECIGALDVLYMTRIQKERFASEQEYKSQAGIYILDGEKMKKAGDHMLVRHPLPKIDEITDEVDLDPRCIYFDQARYGMFARMGLLLSLMHKGRLSPVYPESNVEEMRCHNPKCITNHERYLPQRFIRPERNPAELRCEYCDAPARL